MPDITGGPAFPQRTMTHLNVDESGSASPIYQDAPGMSQLDYFAGQALVAIVPLISVASEASLKTIALQNGLTGQVTNAQIAASVAYGYAHAMLKERETRTGK